LLGTGWKATVFNLQKTRWRTSVWYVATFKVTTS